MIAAVLLACGTEPPAPPPEPVVAPAPIAPVSWPLDLHAPLPCAPGCAREEAARVGVERGVRWLAEHTRIDPAGLKYDVPIALARIRPRFRSELLDAELARLVALLDQGGDPRRRLWDDTARLPDDLPRWDTIPGQQLNTNLALVEALYCPERGFGPKVSPWTCAELRDGGGRKSGHAAWILALAVDQGCARREDTCLDALRDELVAAANDPRPREATLDRDELAEQVLFGTMAGASAADLAPAVDRLLAAQAPDGAFAAPPPGEEPWWTIHATLVGAWALSAWLGEALPTQP